MNLRGKEKVEKEAGRDEGITRTLLLNGSKYDLQHNRMVQFIDP